MADKLALLGGEKTRTEPFHVLPVIGEEEKAQANEVLDNGLLSGFIASPGDAFLGGPKVKEFEKQITDYFGVEHAVAVNSATAGLHAAVVALDLKPGDEVIVTPYSMSASATAILMHGAVPVFADIDPNNYGLDPVSIQSKITDKTKAIMVVHLFGQPANMNEILQIARENSLKVIEDCAQAPGATYDGKKVGTLGDIGVFSLNQHKIITTGEGGFAITNNKEMAFRMQLVRNHGEVVLDSLGYENLEEVPNLLGWNYRINEIEAAIGIAQFNKLDQLTEKRVSLANYLNDNLESIDALTVPVPQQNRSHVYFSYVLRYDKEKASGVSRDVIIDALRAEGIPCAGGYVRPIYWHPAYQKQNGKVEKPYPFHSIQSDKLAYQKGDCPVTERMHLDELIMLPVCHPSHEIEDMEHVVQAFKKVFSQLDALRTSASETVAS